MSKPAVLCVTRTNVEEHIEVAEGSTYALSSVDIIDRLPPDAYHFINRKIVDDKQDITIGRQLPQILPYILIKNSNGEYLSYPRSGTETRLHGTNSIGVGGHIDITDAGIDTGALDVLDTIDYAIARELYEELGIGDKLAGGVERKFTLIDISDEVGQVHLGLIYELQLPVGYEPKRTEEIPLFSWLKPHQLKKDIEIYESWSRILIENLEG